MQLIEIKNDIAKILYSPSKNHLLLADFLLIEDVNQSLIAQIIDIESSEKNDENIITAKFSLSINKNANLSTYNGYSPSKDARIIYVEPDEIAQLIQSSKVNIFWGYLASHTTTPINLGLSFLREKPYILCDKKENATIIATNILYGLQRNKKRTIIIDFDGRYKKLEATTRINIAKEYKLPLNEKAFDFIMEQDLEDCSAENKAVIQGILLELQSYVSQLEDKFIPFDIFKNVIDEECRKNPIPELIIFKNKLVKYQQKSLFAQKKEQFNFLNRILSKKTTTIIDASQIDEKWHRFILETISSQIEKPCYFIVNLNDINSNRNSITTIYDNENIRAISISEYNIKNAFLLKTICKNLILFAPIEKVNDFEVYSSLLDKLNQKEFIIWSENTFYMPLILKLKALDKDYIAQAVSKDIKSDVDRIFTATPITETEEIKTSDEIIIQKDPEEEIENNLNSQIIRSISNKSQTVKTTPLEPSIQQKEQVQDELTEDDLDFLDDINNLPIPTEDASKDEFIIIEDEGKITSEEISDNPESEEQIIFEDEQTATIEEIEEENSNIIDLHELEKISTKTKETENIVETYNKPEPAIEIYEEEIQTQDTTPVQIIVEPEPEIVQKPPERQPEKSLPPEKRTASVPIYEAKTSEPNEEKIKFKEGNFVYHAKYGKGIVEKIINYGNKTLCSIEFDNIGRRLLDPNLADIRPA